MWREVKQFSWHARKCYCIRLSRCAVAHREGDDAAGMPTRVVAVMATAGSCWGGDDSCPQLAACA